MRLNLQPKLRDVRALQVDSEPVSLPASGWKVPIAAICAICCTLICAIWCTFAARHGTCNVRITANLFATQQVFSSYLPQLPRAGVVELDFVEPKHAAADTPLLDAIDEVLFMKPNGRRWIDWKLQVRRRFPFIV